MNCQVSQGVGADISRGGTAIIKGEADLVRAQSAPGKTWPKAPDFLNTKISQIGNSPNKFQSVDF